VDEPPDGVIAVTGRWQRHVSARYGATALEDAADTEDGEPAAGFPFCISVSRSPLLALFTDLLPAAQQPVRCMPDELWQGLPPDPRIEHRAALRVPRGRGF
jgi:uncharacterized protein YfaA (DUF2138 family)